MSHSRFWQQWRDDERYTDHYRVIAATLFSDDSSSVDAWMRGKLSAEDICAKLESTLDLPQEEILRALRESCESMSVVDGAFDNIKQLRALGVRVILATNNMSTFSRWTVRALNLDDVFDEVLNSARLGVLKREKAHDGRSLFFDNYLGESDKAALIDDSPSAVVDDFGVRWLPVDEQKVVDWLKVIMNSPDGDNIFNNEALDKNSVVER